MVINGQCWHAFNSVGDALDCSINNSMPDVLALITDTLDEAEALLLLARTATDYERVDAACRVLAAQLSGVIGHDEGIIFDVLRELSGLTRRHRWAQHMERLQTDRKHVAIWKKETLDWAAATEQRAESLLEEALQDAGFLQG